MTPPKQVAELSGLVSAGERMLQLEQDATQKLRDEREAAAKDAAKLKCDLAATRADHERLEEERALLKEELEK